MLREASAQLDGGFWRFVVSGEGEVGESGACVGLGLGQSVAFAVEHQFRVIDERHAVLLSKVLRSGADEVDVRAFVEHQARGLNGVAQALDAGDSASAESGTIHEQGVELDAAIAGEEAAASGVEGGVVFQFGDCGFDGVGGGGSEFEERVAGLERVKDALLVGLEHVVGNGPGSAVDDEDWSV